MSEDIAVSDTQHLTVPVRITTHRDRPGIARIAVGEQVIFDGDDANVCDATVRVLLPFHVHFEALRLGMVWKEGQ